MRQLEKTGKRQTAADGTDDGGLSDLLARNRAWADAKTLIDSGYRLQAVTPVDQFRHSPHVELVARFLRSR